MTIYRLEPSHNIEYVEGEESGSENGHAKPVSSPERREDHGEELIEINIMSKGEETHPFREHKLVSRAKTNAL